MYTEFNFSITDNIVFERARTNSFIYVDWKNSHPWTATVQII